MRKSRINKIEFKYQFIFVYVMVMILFFSCHDKGKYYGFEKDENGLKYKVIIESANKMPVRIGDYLELTLKYSAANDSVLFNSKEFDGNFKMQVADITHKGGSFETALLMMNPGDHYQFILPADSFFLKTKHSKLPEGVASGTELLFDIQINRIVSKEEIENEKNLLASQMKEQESLLIQQFVIDNKIKEKPGKTGLYYIELKKGNGNKAETGDILTVNYNGKFLDGKLFDSSYKRNTPFSFVLGAGKVIDAWEEGFSNMNEGAKAIFITPSELAYGKEGYGNLIPPFAALVFEVELLNIKKK